MAARIDEQEAEYNKASDRVTELQSAHDATVAKYDALFNEHNMLDAELESANEAIERLRSNLAEADRQTRQGQRRYADQVCSVLVPQWTERACHAWTRPPMLTLAGKGF